MRYKTAIKDALTIEAHELRPLVSLKPGSPFVTYDDKERVLLLTMHGYPKHYEVGATIKLKCMCWTYTDLEFKHWFKKHEKGVYDWKLRLEQLLGLPPSSKCTHVSAMWVPIDHVIRPAYRTDVFNSEPLPTFSSSLEPLNPVYLSNYAHLHQPIEIKHTSLAASQLASRQQTYVKGKAHGHRHGQQYESEFPHELQSQNNCGPKCPHFCEDYSSCDLSSCPEIKDHIERYKAWFERYTKKAYFTHKCYPWTRLGYTYDWYYDPVLNPHRTKSEVVASNAKINDFDAQHIGNSLFDADGDPKAPYGLSEFLVPIGTTVQVKYTFSIDDYIAHIREELKDGL